MYEGAQRITVGFQESHELIVGQTPGLWEVVHAASDSNVYIPIVKQGSEVILFKDGRRKHPDWDAHILVTVHERGAKKVKIFQIDAEKRASGVDNTLLKSNLAVVRSAVFVLTLKG